MKALAALAAISLAGALEGQAVREPVTKGPIEVPARLQVTISAEQRSIRLGGPVLIHSRLKNISPKPVFLNGNFDWRIPYTLSVTEASGTEPALTPSGQEWRLGRFGGSSITPPPSLEPGVETQDFAIDIAKYYQLTQPGTYLVRMRYRIIWPEGTDFVIRVAPPAPRPPPASGQTKLSPREEAVSNEVYFAITP